MINTGQGFECKVLGPYLARPVLGVFLPYIFLEWMHIKLNLDNNCPDLEGLIHQLSRAGYEPFDLVSKKKLLPSRFVWFYFPFKIHAWNILVLENSIFFYTFSY